MSAISIWVGCDDEDLREEIAEEIFTSIGKGPLFVASAESHHVTINSSHRNPTSLASLIRDEYEGFFGERPKGMPAEPAEGRPANGTGQYHAERNEASRQLCTKPENKIAYAIDSMLSARRRSSSSDGQMLDHVMQLLTGDEYEETIASYNEHEGVHFNEGHDWNNGVRDARKTYLTRSDQPTKDVS